MERKRASALSEGKMSCDKDGILRWKKEVDKFLSFRFLMSNWQKSPTDDLIGHSVPTANSMPLVF